MQQEERWVNKKNKLLILVLMIVLILIFLIAFKLNLPCLFKMVFHIPCPSCGMTRALRLIFNLKIIESFKYNILTFPIIIIVIICMILAIFDMLNKKNTLSKFINFWFNNYYLILISLLISFIINIIRKI